MNESNIISISAAIVIISIVISILHGIEYSNKLVADNVNNAITAGIDPLSVRCVYANRQDQICISYAASTKN